jgi:hypothetical protein
MIEKRIAALKQDWIDETTFTAIYGLTRTEHAIERDFVRWGRLQRHRRDVIRDGMVSRFAIENFLQQRGVLPMKWAAAHLGMTTASLEQALSSTLLELRDG